MDYLTNYYKNLAEQLQERLDQLTEEAQLLNEIGDTPAGREALQRYKSKASMAEFLKGRGSLESLDRYKNLANLRIMGKGNPEQMKEVLADQEHAIGKMRERGEIRSEKHAENLRKSGQGPFRDAFVARQTGALQASEPSFQERRLEANKRHREQLERRKRNPRGFTRPAGEE